MRLWSRLVLIAGVVLVVAGVALAFDNPTIDHTDDGTYQCFAPYDTILLGDRNDVGMHTDAAGIEQRCYAANRDRFVWSSILVGAGVASGAGVVLARRRQPA
ncbi:MAG TPA: hypothetical protein VJ872_02490 [Nocardioides sp.]|nr:hypothetical protein [Nocardioides sp.]